MLSAKPSAMTIRFVTPRATNALNSGRCRRRVRPGRTMGVKREAGASSLRRKGGGQMHSIPYTGF